MCAEKTRFKLSEGTREWKRIFYFEDLHVYFSDSMLARTAVHRCSALPNQFEPRNARAGTRRVYRRQNAIHYFNLLYTAAAVAASSGKKRSVSKGLQPLA